MKKLTPVQEFRFSKIAYSRSFIDVINSNYKIFEELGVDFDKVYGCGAFGCAFPTNDPYITAKITRSDREINYYEFCREYSSPIFPAIFMIERLLAKEPDITWHLVLREAVEVVDWYYLMNKSEDNEYRIALLEAKIQGYIDDIAEEVDNNSQFKHLSEKYNPIIYDNTLSNLGFSKLDERIVLFDAMLNKNSDH